MNPLQQAVNNYHQQGFCIIPIVANSKVAAVEWAEYQDRRPTVEELRSWFADGGKNVAVVCGPISGGLSLLDIDDQHLAARMADDVGLRAETSLTSTPRNGLHIWCRETEASSRSGPLSPGVADLKSGGGYAVLPPSVVNGREYRIVTNKNILAVADARAWAIGLLRAYDVEVPEERTEPLSIARTIEEMTPGNRNDSLFRLACKLKNSLSDGDLAAFVRQTGRDVGLPEQEVKDILRSVARYKSGDDGGSPAGPVLVALGDVRRQEVRWLWQDRIPRGRLTGLIGDPGIGKSWLTLALASAVTTGAALPGQEGRSEPCNVLLLTAEDSLSDTLRPRMEDMGADLSRVTVLTAVRDAKGEERHPSLLTDMMALESALATGGYQLVVIDPINAYLGTVLDTHRDAPLRAVLAPLAALAERWGVAIIFVLHLNKRGRERAIYRAQGGIAYVAAARVVHLVGQDPDKADERVLATIKNNLAPLPPAMAFEIRDGRFLWLGETQVTPAALLDPDGDGESKLSEAQDFLREVLAGGPVAVKDIQREAREAGVTDKTLRRAREGLGVKPKRRGGLGSSGSWEWELPVKAPKVPVKEHGQVSDSQIRIGESGGHLSGVPGHLSGTLSRGGGDNGQRLYVLSLAEVQDWPAVSLGERQVNNRTVSVGVPGDRSAWEQAVRYWPDHLLAEVLTRLEAMA